MKTKTGANTFGNFFIGNSRIRAKKIFNNLQIYCKTPKEEIVNTFG